MSQQLEVGICCFGLLESTPPLWCGLVELTAFPLHALGAAVWPRIWAISLLPSDHSDGSPKCICLILGQRKLAQPFSFNHLGERTSILLSWTWIECWPPFWGSLWGARLKLTWRKAEWQGTKSRNCMSLQSIYALGFSDLKTKNSPSFSLSQFDLVVYTYSYNQRICHFTSDQSQLQQVFLHNF